MLDRSGERLLDEVLGLGQVTTDREQPADQSLVGPDVHAVDDRIHQRPSCKNATAVRCVLRTG